MSARRTRTLGGARLPLCAAALGAALAVSSSASAFSTRIHIVIANDLRDAASSDGRSIPLRFSPYSVVLSADDARAIASHPRELRAGAIGPDNTAFPGMTDPSHAIEQRPFEQCQLLYQEAILDEERAYALGCFLHGATDAVAHHYVNYMTGETFTLTPISAARESSWDNVVRHITAESAIQKAAFDLRPTAFAAAALDHRIPKAFVLRAYFDRQSPLWQLMAARPKAKFDAARAADPGASLLSVVTTADLAAADHLSLLPVYLDEVDRERVKLRATISGRLADLQDATTADGATLGVGPGGDGTLGTADDDTACTVSCPSLYATYYVYVALLEPRYDAANAPLPSAFDKISDELRADLFAFLPAYADTVENVSMRLNTPLAPGSEQFSLNASEVAALFAPLDAWASDLTTIDYETLTQSVLPGWVLSVQNALNAVGINVRVSDIVEALFEPFIQPIKDAIEAYAIDQVKTHLGTLVTEYRAKESVILAEYDARLLAAAHPDLGTTPIARFFDAGLYAHSFNVAAAAWSNPAVVLPLGDDAVGVGPASFDASHAPAWMQAAVCSHLRDAIFPFGIDVKGALTVGRDPASGLERRMDAVVTDDSPVECHDGSLSEFAGAPTVESCRLIDVAGLKLDPAHRGTVSRAHPPGLGDEPVPCADVVVDGLPEPPIGGGGAAGSAGGAAGLGAGGASGGAAAAGGGTVAATPPVSGADEGGCG